MHNLPFDFLLLCAAATFFAGGKSLRSFLKDLFSVGTDNWTWSTRSGELFEDVEVEKIDLESIVLKHKFGVCRITMDRLTERSQQLLQHTQQWKEFVSSRRREVKSSAFNHESSHAHAA